MRARKAWVLIASLEARETPFREDVAAQLWDAWTNAGFEQELEFPVWEASACEAFWREVDARW